MGRDFGHFCQNRFNIGQPLPEYFGMAHNTLRIQNDDCPAACTPILKPKTIVNSHLGLRVKIGQQRKSNFKLVGKGDVGGNAVYADAQNLGI